MAIKGSLGEASLPDVLQLLSMGQKTGCLSVSDRSNFGSIFFEQGRISYASIVNRRDRLGDLLVKNHLVEPTELAAAVEAQTRQPEERLGEILIQRGSITRAQMEHYIRLQIEEAVFYLFTWSQGSFYFEGGQHPPNGAMQVSINPENLLLEGARRIDEWSLIEKRIPSLDVVFRLDPARLPDSGQLSPEQQKILPLVDGRRSVQELVDESGLMEFDVGKAVFGLIQAGFAHAVGRRAETQDAPRVRLDEHRNLGLAFYKTGMYEDAAREFRRVAEVAPGALDVRMYLALIELRKGEPRGAVRAFKQLIDAGGTRWGAFHGLALALEELGHLPEALRAAERAARLAGPDQPAPLLSQAILRLKRGEPGAAVERFRRYRATLVEARPPATYYAFATLAEAAAGDVDAALRLGAEGLEHYPYFAPLLLHLGGIRERRGEWHEAEALYRRAAEEGMHIPQAYKALGDAFYRRGVYDDAERAYQRAVRQAPELGDDVYFKLGNISYKRMEREAALRLWRRALEINPANQVVRTNLELVERVLR